MNQIVYAGKHTLTLSVSRHMHTTWELIYCTSGKGTLTFDDQSTLNYGTGDVAVLPPALPHSNRSDEGFTNIHINLANATFVDTEPFILPADPNGFLLNAFQAAFYYYSGAGADQSLLLPVYGQLLAADSPTAPAARWSTRSKTTSCRTTRTAISTSTPICAPCPSTQST